MHCTVKSRRSFKEGTLIFFGTSILKENIYLYLKKRSLTKGFAIELVDPVPT